MNPNLKISPVDYPLHILTEEHRILLEYSKNLIELSSRVKTAGGFSAAENSLGEIDILMGYFKESEKHYLREENVLFPYIEKHGLAGPTKAMWVEHDRIREIKKGLYKLLAERSGVDFGRFADSLLEYTRNLNEMLISHFGKENGVLFPAAKRLLSEGEWGEILQQFGKIGLCSFSPKIQTEEAEPVISKYTDISGRIPFETGELLKEQIEAMFNTLPVEVTFIDENDTVRYFSQPQEMLFPRAKAIIGRQVQNCHPEKSVHLVNKILEDFKAGRREVAEFWLDLKGKFVYIRYFPVWDGKGKYLGCMEVTQDVTGIKKLSGEKRLLE